ncbi:MAG: universal stress protein [Deltaproteobacteria bacterium]|nr:universal stress protein [Deltaproteobacteria bacterium]
MIPNINTILFSTDLSQKSRYAFNYAVSIAHRYGAKLTLLYVMEEVSHSPDVRLKDFIGEERWQEIKGGQEEEARQILIGKKREGATIRQALGEFCEQIQAESKIDFKTDQILVVRGNVVDEILSEAQRIGCDLIVMGYHVRGKLEEAVLGSTTRRVLRRSKTPVMLVQLVEEEG